MKLGGDGRRIELGGQKKPTGGTTREPVTLERRPDVSADGIEYEVVWYPNANAASLLPDGGPSRKSSLVTPGTVTIRPQDPNKKDRWSWLG